MNEYTHYACVTLCITLGFGGGVYALHASSVRGDFIKSQADAATAKAAEQAETNRHALRIECTKAGRLWLESASLCLQPDPQKAAK